MRRLLAPTFVVPMGAAGLLALVFLYYYFPARMRREAIVNEQAFRQLGTYTDLIQNRIANYGTVVKQWATQADKQGGATTKGFADQVPELHYEKLPDDSGGLNVDVSSDDRGSIQLKLKYDHYSGGIPLEQLVSAFVTPQQDDGFDEVLIVNNSDGSVLYQTRRTGIRLRSIPSVRTGKSGGEAKSTSDAAEKPPASGAAATTTDTVPIGGSQYRLYSSPLPIRLNRPNADPTLDWTMCGVISDSRMRSHILGTPGYVLVMVALALSLMLVTAWPALKFSTMRAGERVPRRAGVYYLATTVVAIILSVMLGIHIWSLTSDFDRTDEKLSLLADAIDANLTEETNSALKALHGAMNSSHFDAEAKELTVNKEPCGASEDLHTKDFQTRAVSNLLARKDVNLGGYPFFDQIFWTDRNGFQQMKWTIRPEATPTVRLCNYTFFTETLENHLWYFKDQPEGDKFRIDPMYSPNTGKYNALISQRSSRSNA